DFFHLAGRQAFVRVEAPETFEQSLAPENLVDPGDAAVEIVGDVEQRGVRVGEVVRDLAPLAMIRITMDAFEHLDSAARPDSPLAEQSAYETQFAKAGDQVKDDVVVVAGVEGDPGGAAGIGDAMEYLDRL